MGPARRCTLLAALLAALLCCVGPALSVANHHPSRLSHPSHHAGQQRSHDGGLHKSRGGLQVPPRRVVDATVDRGLNATAADATVRIALLEAELASTCAELKSARTAFEEVSRNCDVDEHGLEGSARPAPTANVQLLELASGPVSGNTTQADREVKRRASHFLLKDLTGSKRALRSRARLEKLRSHGNGKRVETGNSKKLMHKHFERSTKNRSWNPYPSYQFLPNYVLKGKFEVTSQQMGFDSIRHPPKGVVDEDIAKNMLFTSWTAVFETTVTNKYFVLRKIHTPDLVHRQPGHVEDPRVRVLMERVRSGIVDQTRADLRWPVERSYCWWQGVECNSRNMVRMIVLDGLLQTMNFTKIGTALDEIGTIETLIITGKHWKDLPPELFGISSLVHLSITDASTTHLPHFGTRMVNLKYLLIELSELVEITPRFGEGLSRLREMTLHTISRVGVAHRTFSETSNHIQDSGYELGKETLHNMTSLRVLIFRTKRISEYTLPPLVGSQVPNLAVLIAEVPRFRFPPSFGTLKELAFVSLNVRKRSILGAQFDEVFPRDVAWPKLVSLSVRTDERMLALPEGLCHSQKLRYLEVHDSTALLRPVVTALPVCKSFPEMRVIVLATSVPEYPYWMFNDMPHLWAALVGGDPTRETVFPSTVGRGLLALEHINLYVSGGDVSIPEFAEPLPNLSYFACIQCKALRTIPSLAGCPSLRAVMITDSAVDKVPALPMEADLDILALDDSRISYLDPSICALKRLRSIRLKGNRLESLPECFGADGSLSSLESMGLDMNRLSSLPQAIENLRSLKSLQATGNRLTRVDLDFRKMTALASVFLSQNHLEEFPRGLMGALEDTNSRIQIVSLELNPRLKTIPAALFTASRPLLVLKIGMAALMRPDRASVAWTELAELSNEFAKAAASGNRGPRFSLFSISAIAWYRIVTSGQHANFHVISSTMDRLFQSVGREKTVHTFADKRARIGSVQASYVRVQPYVGMQTALVDPNPQKLWTSKLYLAGCEVNYYLRADGSCSPCPQGGLGMCYADHVECPTGYIFRPDDGGGRCNFCPEGSRCSGNTEALALAGFWNAPGSRDRVYKCEMEQACLGTDSVTAGNVTSADGCRDGYHGPLCSLCVAGHYKTNSGSSLGCQLCPTIPISLFWTLTQWVTVAIAFIATVYIGEIGDVDTAVRVGDPVIIRSAVVKVMVGFSQTLGLVTAGYAVDWPGAMSSLSKSLALSNLSLTRTSSVECLAELGGGSSNYFHSLMAYCFLPIAFVVVTVAALILFALLHKASWFRHTPIGRLRPKKVQSFATRLVVTLVLLVYLPVSSRALAFFSCVEFGGSVYYLQQDMAIKCYTHIWYSYLPLVCGVLFVYTLCFPLLILLHTKVVPKRFWSYFNVIQEPYRRGYKWWESMELIRKVLIGAAIGLLPGASVFVLTLSLMVSFLALILHLRVMPFVADLVNHLQTSVLLMVYLSMLLGILPHLKMPHRQYMVFAVIVVVLDVILILGLLAFVFSAVWVEVLRILRRKVSALTLKLRRGVRRHNRTAWGHRGSIVSPAAHRPQKEAYVVLEADEEA